MTTQFPASAEPPEPELLAWNLVQVLFFSAACLVVQFGGGPALFFFARLLGGPIRGGPALLFFRLLGCSVWAWSRFISVDLQGPIHVWFHVIISP